MGPELPGTTQFFWLLLAAFVVTMAARRFRAPYALALVLTGLVIGVPRLLPRIHLQPALVFGVLLPPLLFEGAINLRIGPLLRDWRPIAIFSVAGTVLSTLVVGSLTAWALRLSLSAGMVFGALVSATDPISVLAVFKRLGADRRLTLIVEAESLFNDGVAVVLFSISLAAVAGGSTSLAGGAWQFLRFAAGGAAVGAGIGWLASRIHFEVDDHLVEITLTTVVAFGSYLAAGALNVSGVIAVVAAGLVIGNYAVPRSMTPGTQLAVGTFWEYAAFLVNSIVFLLVGIEAALVQWWHNLPQVLGAIGAVLLGRACIYPLSSLVNRIGGTVPRPWQHVLFWGGLRGALSMALVLGLPAEFPQRDALVSGTFGVVLFSLLVQGLTVGPLLRRMRLVEQPGERSAYHRIAAGLLACEAALGELDRLLSSEAVPAWAVKVLTEKYRAEQAALEEAADALGLGAQERQQEQQLLAQRQALAAKKTVLLEAERRGWLDEEEWRNLTARVNAELSELIGKGEA